MSREGSNRGSSPLGPGLVWPVAALATVTLILGLGAHPLLLFAERAARILLDPSPYILAVLGGG